MVNEKFNLVKIANELDILFNEMTMIDSLAYVAFTAADCNISSAGEFAGTLQLLSSKTQEICNKLNSLLQDLHTAD